MCTDTGRGFRREFQFSLETEVGAGKYQKNLREDIRVLWYTFSIGNMTGKGILFSGIQTGGSTTDEKIYGHKFDSAGDGFSYRSGGSGCFSVSEIVSL